MNHRLISWWQDGVIYQSIRDPSKIRTATELEILQALPIACLFVRSGGRGAYGLLPSFPSPMADFGYDVSEYCDVDPTFGALSDFDDLVSAAHNVGITVIIDLSPNHTSDQHPWFIESRRSRFNSKRDWYVWRDPKADDSPPNNWLERVRRSRVDVRSPLGAILLSCLSQATAGPQLAKPRCSRSDVRRTEGFGSMRGVDGFRVDAIHHLYEDQEGADNPPNPTWREGMSPARRLLRKYTMDQPETHEAIREMRRS